MGCKFANLKNSPSLGGRACGLQRVLLVLLGDAKKLLAAELLEGQLQDLLQDLLVAVSLTEGVRLGLGLGPILPDAVANNLLLERTSPGTQLLFLLLLLFLNV